MSTKQPHPADALSFMKRRKPRGTGIDYWIAESTGDCTADWEKGRALSEEFLSFIGRHPTAGSVSLLGPIVNSMMEKRAAQGRLSGVELAFLAGVMGHATSAAIAIEKWRARRCRAAEMVPEAAAHA